MGDFVLSSFVTSRTSSELKKLSPVWEGPYVVIEVVENGELDGKLIQNT